MGCDGRHAPLWPRDPCRPWFAAHRAPPTDWSCRGLLAVEFSDELAGPQGRRCAVVRMLHHPEGLPIHVCFTSATGNNARPLLRVTGLFDEQCRAWRRDWTQNSNRPIELCPEVGLAC